MLNIFRDELTKHMKCNINLVKSEFYTFVIDFNNTTFLKSSPCVIATCKNKETIMPLRALKKKTMILN